MAARNRTRSAEHADKLTPAIIAMGSASGLGTRSADFTPYGAGDADFASGLVDLLADHDDAFFAAYVDDEATVSYRQLRGELAAQTGKALVHPVFFGSAITGAGVDALISGITELLPAAEGDADGPVSGAVFKVERVRPGTRSRTSACSRERYGCATGCDFAGTRRGRSPRSVFSSAARPSSATSVAAGRSGSSGVSATPDRRHDRRAADDPRMRHYFAPPTLETVVVPRRPPTKARCTSRSPSSPSRTR